MTTDKQNYSAIEDVFQELIEKGPEGFKSVLEWFWNECLQAERNEFLQADPYERKADRVGYANGYKNKRLKSRLGALDLKVPQVRGHSFYPRSLEKGCRSEVALKLAIGEMYVQGVSTRRVDRIVQELCGINISSSQVSRISRELDEKLEQFRNRQLDETPFLILDARYEKVRYAESVRDCAVLIAAGITPTGQREVLGVSVSLSEAEVHWREFMQSLVKRGLTGVKLIISDDHQGLRAARQAVFSGVNWQRCQFHMAQNAQAYVPKKAMREEIGQTMRDIFNARNLDEARLRVKETVEIYQKKAPDFALWLEENVEEGFTVFNYPTSMRRRLRTSNMLEALNKQIKRRTRVAGLFPNPASCLRLVTAVVQEQHEEWSSTNRSYLNLEELTK